MHSNWQHQTSGAPRPRRPLNAQGKGWAVLVLSFVAVFLFLLVLGPMGLRTGPIKPLADFIEQNEIQANAYFYTDVEDFSVAERHMREHLGCAAGPKRFFGHFAHCKVSDGAR